MDDLDVETTLKVIVVGNGMVGKSTLVSQFGRGVVTGRYKKTIGTEYTEKNVTLSSGEEVTLMIWDIAGQDMFSKLTSSYFQGAAGVVYAFSTTDRESFLAIDNWRQRVLAACGCDEGTEPLSVIVQTKIDLMSEAVVSFAEGDALASRLKMPLFRVATTPDSQPNEVFPYLAARHLRTLREASLGVAGELTASRAQNHTGVATLSSLSKLNALNTADLEGSSGLHEFAVPLSTTARQIITNESTFGTCGSSEEAVASAYAAVSARSNKEIAAAAATSQPFVPYWDRKDVVLPSAPLTKRGQPKQSTDGCNIA